MFGSGCRVSSCSHFPDFGEFEHGLVIACFGDHPTYDRGKQLHLIWTCVNTTRIKKLHEVTGMVEKWKMNTRRLMVDFKEELSSGLKRILVEMLPGDAAEHLSQKISDADQYEHVNEMILWHVETKADFDWRWTTSSSTTGISAFTSRTTRETWTWCTKARAATSTVIATAAPSCCRVPWEVLDAVLLLRIDRTPTPRVSCERKEMKGKRFDKGLTNKGKGTFKGSNYKGRGRMGSFQSNGGYMWNGGCTGKGAKNADKGCGANGIWEVDVG